MTATQNIDPLRCLTRKEVAGLLGVSVATVLRLEKDGELPCSRIGGRTARYLARDVYGLVERSKSAPVYKPRCRRPGNAA